MIYVIYIFILLLLLSFERRERNARNVFRLLIPLVYILFVGLRGAHVGVDTPVYYQHYYTFGEWGCEFVEVGFDWLNRFCYHQGWSQAPFFVICAAFAILPVIYAINSELTRKEYSVFMLLYCTTTFITLCNGMRQSMACGLFFLLVCIIQKSERKFMFRLLAYILGIIIVSLFHTSIFIVSPLILLSRIELTNKKYVLIYILSFVFVFINMSAFLPDVELGNRDYGRYLGGELTNKSASSLGFVITTLRNVVFLFLMIKTNAFAKRKLIANSAFLMLVLDNLGFYIPLMGRINMYFSLFFILMLTIIISNAKTQIRNGAFILILLLMSITVVLCVYGIISPANKVMPYSFYWEDSNYYKYIQL